MDYSKTLMADYCDALEAYRFEQQNTYLPMEWRQSHNNRRFDGHDIFTHRANDALVEHEIIVCRATAIGRTMDEPPGWDLANALHDLFSLSIPAVNL